MAQKEFKPEQLIDSEGSFFNKTGLPYIQCTYQWIPPRKGNPWDHGYFLYRGDGPSGRPDICDKIGAKIVGWYFGKLIPEKRVAWRSQLNKVYIESVQKLSENFQNLEFKKTYSEYPNTIKDAILDLIDAGCETIIYQSINCPLYSDFEDYGYILPMLHELAKGRARIILADQLGNQPAYREAYFKMLNDQLRKIGPKKSVLIILSRHGHPFRNESMEERAHLYHQPLEDGIRNIMSNHRASWDITWTYDEYADPFWDKKNKKMETRSAYQRAIMDGFDYAIELPTEFPAENTDLMIFHAMKKFNVFSEYDFHHPVPYPDWEKPLVRIYKEGKTIGVYAGTPVGPYRKYVVKAVVDSISMLM